MARVDIDAARALCEAATAEPWVNELDIFEAERGYEAVVSNKGTEVLFTSQTEVEVHQPPEPWTDKDSAIRDARVATAKATQPMRDAAFIAAARSILPQALTEIEELRGELTTARVNMFEAERQLATVERERDKARGEAERRGGILARVRQGCRDAVAKLGDNARAEMGAACRNTPSQCFCGMHSGTTFDTDPGAWRTEGGGG